SVVRPWWHPGPTRVACRASLLPPRPTTVPSRCRDRVGSAWFPPWPALRGTNREAARAGYRTSPSRSAPTPKPRRSTSTTEPRSCRGSTKPSTRPSACSNGETAWRRHRSIGKVQGGGTWFFSGKWKCLSHFSLPEPCLAFLLPRAQKPTPKRGKALRRHDAATEPRGAGPTPQVRGTPDRPDAHPRPAGAPPAVVAAERGALPHPGWRRDDPGVHVPGQHGAGIFPSRADAGYNRIESLVRRPARWNPTDCS